MKRINKNQFFLNVIDKYMYLLVDTWITYLKGYPCEYKEDRDNIFINKATPNYINIIPSTSINILSILNYKC